MQNLMKICGLIGVLVLTGCAGTHMVQSTRVSNSDAQQGLLYSLPKQLVKVEYKRSPIKKPQAKAAWEKKKLEKAELIKEKAALEGQTKILEGLIQQLNLDATNNADILAKRKAELVELKAKSAINMAKLVAANKAEVEAFYTLNRFNATDSESVFTETLKLTPLAPIPDPNNVYNAKILHEGSTTDSLNLKVKNGLLSGAVGYTEDNTGDIAVSLAGSIAAFTGFPSQHMALMKERTDFPPILGCTKKPSVNIEYKLDVEDPSDLILLNNKLAAGCLKLSVIQEKQNKLSTIEGPNTGNGLLYRHPAQVTFAVIQVGGDKLSQQKLLLAQAGPIGVIEMPRSNFARNDYSLTFADGLLSEASIVQPSEWLALANYIPEIGKAILSIPAEILQLKVDYSSKEAALAEKQALQQQQALAFEKAKAELEAYYQQQQNQ